VSDRPTPEQLARDLAAEADQAQHYYPEPVDMLHELHVHGYVIVHPDDEEAVFQLAVDAGIIVKRRSP
jgi:hypothetical protein